MSNACVYFPVPTRVWSRVQNKCTYVDSSNNNYYDPVIIPLPVVPSTQQPVSLAEANYQEKLIYKGNILQYKGNSSRLTKKQQYTQLAKGFGPNRTKVFATQTQTYTNPNTSGLQRVNYTTLPFPNTLVGRPNNISGPFQYAVPNPNGCLNVDGSPSTSLQDGGTLVCGTYADPCTGELIKANNSSAAICNPASASNVPGPSVLCWNKNIQTWFPRQRYVMNTSGTKWPQGYKGFASAILFVPLLTASATCSQILLTWTSPPASANTLIGYNIYVNNNFYASVPPKTTSYEFNEPIGSYSIYITNMVSPSVPSNTVNILIIPGGKVISSSNIKSTHYSGVVYLGDTYSGLVIETTDPPSTTGVSAGVSIFTVCATVTDVSLLIVGGGGGGSSGYTTSGGAGGGGGGVIAVTGLTSPTNTNITVQVGAGGAARTQVSGPGASAGYQGVASSVSISGANLIAGGGGPGYGVGSTGPGGGSGGNTTRTGSSGGIDIGYGGSGGGGAWASTSGANASKLGPGGTGFSSAGSDGTAGSTTFAGNGGSQIGSPVTVPILPITTVNVGGGGGGGGPTLGGNAGDGAGGAGDSASGGSGQFATNYGGGGGGGDKNFVGGSGGSGVVMIWYKL